MFVVVVMVVPVGLVALVSADSAIVVGFVTAVVVVHAAVTFVAVFEAAV